MKIWSIGHSTHTLPAFVSLLHEHEIEELIDIRSVPKSRRHPHFHIDNLLTALPDLGIGYRDVARLGGWRRPSEDIRNGAWRNSSFRGYADYALGPEFAEGLALLRELGAERRTAMMCSEALWWRCHRRVVADWLVAGGACVCHIGSDGSASTHEMADFASVDPEGLVTYPA